MQTTSNVLLIRPSGFVFNAETAVSNAFQQVVSESEEGIQQKVAAEFEAFAARLKASGVNVFIKDDTPFPQKPDAIFPNNWVSFHADGTVVLYPMQAINRRQERRLDIIESLQQNFRITRLLDLSVHEKDNRFLEGTGSIVFDHENKIAYACLSPRTDKDLLITLCNELHYQPIYFFAHDPKGQEIYHTNVMMCIAEKFAVVCLESIVSAEERSAVTQSLTSTGHKIINISLDQMNHFAGNMLALKTAGNKPIIALSESAYHSLEIQQRQAIEQYASLVPLAIPTIETIGGGSARCMIAEVFCEEV